ncbi:MAG: hypothetical protein JNK82_26085 [Myxococcaceae bacterium]|nr:hypothetical protein [Myxococcaceae bacterium]
MRLPCLAAALFAASCQCVGVPDGPYECNLETGEDCDGGEPVPDAGEPDAGEELDAGPDLPFPTDLCNGQWCWEHPQPLGRIGLRSVLALARDDVWAAGGGGNIIHWDGQRWQQVPTGTSGVVQRIWAGNRRTVWFVGQNGAVFEWSNQRLMRHDAGTPANLLGISGFGPRDIVVVGSNNTVLRHDDDLWSRPIVPGASGALITVQAWPDGGVLALGDFGLQLQDGTWANVPRPLDAGQIAYTFAPSRDDVWAVGAGGGLYRNLSNDFTSASRWQAIDSLTNRTLSAVFRLGNHTYWGSAQGGLWESTNLQQVSNRAILAIHGRSESDVWAVGINTILHRRVAGAFFEDLTPAELTNEPLTAVVAVPGGGAWATGRNHVMMTRDGGTWNRVRTAGNVTGGWYDDVWTKPGSPVIAVGTDPVRLAYWDAGAQEMSPVGLSVPNELWAVWGSSANDIWAVGYDETIVHYAPTGWSVLPQPGICTNNDRLIESVWGFGQNDVWFAGGSGCVMHWNGASFTDESLPGPMNNEALSAVVGRGGEVWVASHSGRIFRRTGTRTWAPETIVSSNVRKLAVHEGELYAVGDAALIAKRDANGSWVRMPAPVEGTPMLQGIGGAPGEGLYVAGDTGTILRRR